MKEGNTNPDVSSLSNFSDDKYLQPVLEDDALLFSLDDLIQPDDGKDQITATEAQTSEARIAELEAQLKSLNAQFTDFRLQVDQTLERRWAESTGEAPIAEASTSVKGHDYDGDYFNSYSYNGRHCKSFQFRNGY